TAAAPDGRGRTAGHQVRTRLPHRPRRSVIMEYDDILVAIDGPVLTITINRPDAGNKFRHQTCLELFDALQRFRLDPDLRAAVLTGAGEKFFCIGGEHDPMTALDQSQVLPIIDVYQAIDTIPKP